VIKFFADTSHSLYSRNNFVPNTILIFGSIVTVSWAVSLAFLMANQRINNIKYENLQQNCEKQKGNFASLTNNLNQEISLLNYGEKIGLLGSFRQNIQTGTIVWSKQMYVLYKVPEGSKPIKFSELVDQVLPDHQRDFSLNLEKMSKSEKIYEFIFPTKGDRGNIKWLLLRGYAIIKDGQPLEMIGISQDITKLQRQREFQEEFNHVIFSQLTNALNKIKKFVEDILGGEIENLTQAQFKTLKDTGNLNQNAIEIIDGFLNINELESNKIRFEMRMFHPIDLIKSVLSKYNDQIEDKRIALTVEVDKKVSPIVSDVGKLQSVLSIIISNAIKYSPHLAKLIIKIDVTYDNVIFLIKDNGYGIPTEEKKYIFGKFYRGSNILKAEPSGTGMNLYYAKKILEMLGGKIILDSVIGQGTTLTIYLPKRISQ